jgi:hypothetical protein
LRFFTSPFFVHRKRSKTGAVSLTVAEGTLGSLIWGALFNDGVAINSEKQSIKQQAAGSGGLSVGWRERSASNSVQITKRCSPQAAQRN